LDTLYFNQDTLILSREALLALGSVVGERSSIWVDIFLAVGTGIVSGIIAAYLYLKLMQLYKPKVEVSKCICKSERPKNGTEMNSGTDTETVYHIKFINYTKYSIENISLDLFLMKDYFYGNGKNYKATRLNLKVDSFKFLAGTKGKDEQIHNNCVQLTIDEDLEKIWKGDHDWLQLQITAYHSKSGFRKVFVQKFISPDVVIQDGKFDVGHTFNIIEVKRKFFSKHTEPSAVK
jgi:hypothetical protein